jgi:hypothetical protein
MLYPWRRSRFPFARAARLRTPGENARKCELRTATPEEYVKVCSLYGAGYYYIPGTDICQKIGGYVRYENTYGYGQSITAGPFTTASGPSTRTAGIADYVNRVRAYITQETRQQTAYGTLRTYLNVGVNFDSPAAGGSAANAAGGFNANRAFIQIAGFTFGRATSYYDFYSAPATSYFAPPSSDSGDPGMTVAAYTAQLGNGLSTSLSFEDPAGRRQTVANTSLAFTGGFYPANSQRKVEFPDIVANLRIDQAWGSAQVMGAIHDASAGYYGATSATGYPEDTTLGWAVGAGLKVNFPMFGPGDYLQAQVNYANGASRYVATSLGGSNALSVNGSSFGYGVVSDAVYTGGLAPTGVNLTTSWGVNAAYEHFWTPSVRTSVYGSYFRTTYNDQANAALCVGQGFGLAAGCNNNYGMWTVGSRTQWNVTKDFYVGLDTIYLKLNTASAGTSFLAPAGIGGATAPGVYTTSDQSAWAVRFRAHRDIVP